MVAFPRLENEARILSATDLDLESHQFGTLDSLTPQLTGTPGQGHSILSNYNKKFATMVPQHERGVAPTLALGDCLVDVDLKKTKSDLPADKIVAEPAIVKKIAAGLITNNELKESSSKYLEGSLSSISSIITIESEPNTEKEFSNDSNDGGDPNPQKPKKKRSRLITDEAWHHTAFQISVPFFIAGIGTIGAGLVLAKVTEWEVFKRVSEIFILVPALLGLKGNLDMCLASRLSTQANLGNMKGFREILKMIIGNIALVQVQAIVASVIVSCFASLIGAATSGSYVWNHSLLMVTSCLLTATSSCFILDFAMIGVIMAAKYLRMNPDNLATPLAASIGDVVSISVLSGIASVLYQRLNTQIWILYTVLAVYALLLPIWIFIVMKNKYTRNVLTSGWTPVISALFISGLGGLILDRAVDSLQGFVIFQPIINGIGGNLVSVQASRISTMFHQTSIIGILPPITKTWVSPWKAIFHGVPSAKSARLLIFMCIPGHLAFSFMADYMKWGHSTLHPYFVASYLFVAVMQVMLLLYIAHVMIHVMWKYKIDPDNSAIPYLTALGDLSGSLFLAIAFVFLQRINREYGEYKA